MSMKYISTFSLVPFPLISLDFALVLSLDLIKAFFV